MVIIYALALIGFFVVAVLVYTKLKIWFLKKKFGPEIFYIRGKKTMDELNKRLEKMKGEYNDK